jgi:hypothetical protein
MSGRNYDDNGYNNNGDNYDDEYIVDNDCNNNEDDYDDEYIDYHEAQREYNDAEQEWEQDHEGWSDGDKIGHLLKMKFLTEQYVHYSYSVSKPAIVLATSSTFLDHTNEG